MMRTRQSPFLLLAVTLAASSSPLTRGAESTEAATSALNATGVDLLVKGTTPGFNTLLSPYSIQTALAMTFAGAAGETREEMAKVLHFTGDEAALHRSFAELQQALEEVQRRSAARVEEDAKQGRTNDPTTLTIANRLFGQRGYEFREAFLTLTKDSYRAPLQPLDFKVSPPDATRVINGWVEMQTRQRIRDLIPPNVLNKETRLVLANAIYLKAPWREAFTEQSTRPERFLVNGRQTAEVPTMNRVGSFGWGGQDDWTALTIPYADGQLQLLILLPDENNGLAGLEAKLTPAMLEWCARLRDKRLNLYLPKFKLEPPLLQLGKVLQSLGMRAAFNQPTGSANFDRMAPRKPDDYLYISEVFHKTFLSLDEQGTEAAAATAVVMMRATSIVAETPVEVRVDHPFLFAIQHRASGACLFLGRVTDPR
jgi:serpin B